MIDAIRLSQLDHLALVPAPAFSPTPLALKPDLDAIEALAPERDALWARLQSATFLTGDEKRAAAGYGLMPGSKLNPWHNPFNGQFTSGPGGGTILIADRYKEPGKPKVEGPGSGSGGWGGSGSTPGATPKGRTFSSHGREEANRRGFADERIDAIIDNNKRVSNGVDEQGRKTWSYTDNRGNTVIMNEGGGIVTVFSSLSGGFFIPKP